MTPDFIVRMIGMVVFGILGVRFGADNAELINMAQGGEVLFGLVGILTGIILTPWLTTRPIRNIRRSITEWPIERLLISLFGMFIGLFMALLIAYPLSLIETPLGDFVPALLSSAAAYLGLTIFGTRSREIVEALGTRVGRSGGRIGGSASRKLLLDTSVLIDGRIAEIAETGFLDGTLIVPRFVLSELHRVADSSDFLRRQRGRRGLSILNKLQRNDVIPVRIVEDDVEGVNAVDDKLVALAIQMTASVMTNDYNLNQVADAQGVPVLNINELANAVRSIYIPGETFPIRIFQEGRDPDQGVGYLEDGTMVIVENGKTYMDRTIPVEVTKLINRPTGRMIFAVPESEKGR